MKAYDKVQVVPANWYNYKVMGWSRKTRTWVHISYHDWLWTAKLAANRAARLEATDPSVTNIYYEVSNVHKATE